MKYAIVLIKGKQYLVAEKDTIELEKIEGKEGKKIVFENVLLYKDKEKVLVGKPYVKECQVKAEIVNQFKDKKIRVAKFRAKSRYRLVKGHRQQKTRIKILKILS